MASKTPGQTPVRAIFLKHLFVFFAHFWVYFLTIFWPSFGPPLGVSLGVSWEPSRASWGSLGKPLDPKTLKKIWVFKVFENAAFWLFEAPDGSLGLILPPLWPIWSQNGPQNGSQNCSKKEPKIVQFFCPKWILVNINFNLGQFWNPNWTSTFAQKSKKIYKRNQDEPKRAIMSFKESFQTPQKTSSFYTFLGPEASQESLKKPKSRPRSTQRAPKAHAKNCPKKSQKMLSW